VEAGQARIDRIAPRSAEAAGDPDLAVRGTQSIREVMVATEVEVASMLARVDADVARLIGEADAAARERVSDRREQLAGVRRELALWGAAVAVGFENLLGLLDEADARMAVPAPAPPAREAVPAAQDGAVSAPQPPPAAPVPHLRLAESPASAATGVKETQAPADGAEEADVGETTEPPRRRWWQRWFRQAA
jgi:hypothetical protein